MRRAYQDVDFINDNEKNNLFIGISLGYDFCAEHEWGIKGMRINLGMPADLEKNNFGLKFRTMTVFDEKCFTFFKTKKKFGKTTYKFAILIFDRDWLNYGTDRLPHDLKNYQSWMIPSKWDKEGKEIMTAWDENGFGIIVRDEENIKFLEDLLDAFKKKDICIGLFGGGPFANARLTIAIKSRMPEGTDEMMKNADLESYETKKLQDEWEKKAAKASKKSFKDFMCISPRFFAFGNKEEEKEEMKKYNTKYNFHIWINASNDNYGWYTGEQVENWLKSKDKQLKEFKNECE